LDSVASLAASSLFGLSICSFIAPSQVQADAASTEAAESTEATETGTGSEFRTASVVLPVGFSSKAIHAAVGAVLTARRLVGEWAAKRPGLPIAASRWFPAKPGGWRRCETTTHGNLPKSVVNGYPARIDVDPVTKRPERLAESGGGVVRDALSAPILSAKSALGVWRPGFSLPVCSSLPKFRPIDPRREFADSISAPLKTGRRCGFAAGSIRRA
jgi:hypothetical protein